MEHWPDNGGAQVHQHGEEPVSRQELGEGDGQAASALAHAQHHHGHREDEADAVHGHAPLQPRVVVVRHWVTDQDENDARHEGLANLEQTRCCGHVARHLSGSGFGQAHLHHVGYSGQAGEDGGSDAVAASFAAHVLAFEKEEWEDNGGREAEQGGVAGHCDGEVRPGDRGSGLQAALLHQQYQQGADKAEHPAEEAPVAQATVGNVGPMCRNAESNAGEDQCSESSPEQLREGKYNHWHGWRKTISPEEERSCNDPPRRLETLDNWHGGGSFTHAVDLFDTFCRKTTKDENYQDTFI